MALLENTACSIVGELAPGWQTEKHKEVGLPKAELLLLKKILLDFK